jgi:hypothetical protein
VNSIEILAQNLGNVCLPDPYIVALGLDPRAQIRLLDAYDRSYGTIAVGPRVKPEDDNLFVV